MSIYKRHLDLSEISRKSIFLFGPRQTGKSRLLKTLFPDAIYYDLLLSEVYLRFTQSPKLFREEILASLTHKQSPLVIVDEIQRLPILLNEVHWLIENKDLKFILTGSSARKLKSGGANLLGGRALERHLFPLTTAEVPNYDLNRMINFGQIPSIYNSSDPLDDLYSYAGIYLKEEIQAEGLVRGIEQFSSFLEKAALVNGELINFANIASDLGVSAKTVKEYFHILEDTLVGKILPPFKETKKRKAIATAKFYFFDVGVANVLAKRKCIEEKSELFSRCLEHFIFTELRAYLSYQKDRRELSFWRSTNGQEVDFVIGNEVAIEVKATNRVSPKHLKGISALSEEIPFKYKIVVSLDDAERIVEEEIHIMPCREFLKRLWANEFR